MAILGGAGNPVGGSFTGAAQALEIYGDFAAAYSGQIQVNTSAVEHLNFTTGNYLFVGELTCHAGAKADSPASGDVSIFDVSFNNINVFLVKVDAEVEKMPSESVVPIIIPPYTLVSISADSGSASAGFVSSAELTGRIYRS